MYYLVLFLDHEASKVHFSSDVTANTEINIVNKSDGRIDVHLGFLQEGHTYEVQFPFPNHLPEGWMNPAVPDPAFQLISLEQQG